MDEGLIWLASYPKSGNTWLRCLLEAYRCNGQLNINDMRIATGDSSRVMTQCVCPIDAKNLTEVETYLLRPAALLQMLATTKVPRFVKTHFSNMQPIGCAPFIPACWTSRAVYIVRDPRSIAVSASAHFGYSTEQMVRFMASDQFSIATETKEDPHTQVYIGDWSKHVESWQKETQFPVFLLKYEDLLENTEQVFKVLIEFLGMEYDEARAKRSIRAASLRNLRKAEDKDGFRERSRKAERFFNQGGTRWEQELGPKFVSQIEKDHHETMKKWGYL